MTTEKTEKDWDTHDIRVINTVDEDEIAKYKRILMEQEGKLVVEVRSLDDGERTEVICI